MDFHLPGLVLTLLFIYPSSASTCPEKCNCKSGKVVCHNLNLIPKLPNNTKYFKSINGSFSRIDSRPFKQLPNLKYIFFDKVTKFKLKAQLPKLKLIWVKYYQGDTLNSRDYIGAVNLEQIQYEKSNIKHIKITKGLENLKWLHLTRLPMEVFDLSVLNKLPHLSTAMMQHSKFKKLKATSTIRHLHYLNLEHTETRCSCHVLKKLVNVNMVRGRCRYKGKVFALEVGKTKNVRCHRHTKRSKKKILRKG